MTGQTPQGRLVHGEIDVREGPIHPTRVAGTTRHNREIAPRGPGLRSVRVRGSSAAAAAAAAAAALTSSGGTGLAFGLLVCGLFAGSADDLEAAGLELGFVVRGLLLFLTGGLSSSVFGAGAPN